MVCEDAIGAIFEMPHAMSRFLTLIATLTILTSMHGQGRSRTVHTDTGNVVLHYFTTGQVSTKEWTDTTGYWGGSWAYNRSGEVIFEGQTRRVAGHASVKFSYHPNGAVSKVETSDAPDGGIQWYRSTTTFDEDGNKTGFDEYGRDNYGPIPRPGIRIITEPEPPPSPPKKEVAICQRMFRSELFVVNPTNAAVRVVASPKYPSPALPGGTWTMAPGDTIRIGTFSKGEVWPEWNGLVELHIVQVVLGDRNKAVARTRTDEHFLGEEHRQLHVVIEGWANAHEDGAPAHVPVKPADPKPATEAPEPKRRWWWRFRVGR